MSQSKSQVEEEHDVVHELQGEITSATAFKNVQASGILQNQLPTDQALSANFPEGAVSPYRIKMESGMKQMSDHVYYCNMDFKENVMKKVQTIQL